MKVLYLIPLVIIFYAVAIVANRKKYETWLLPWEWFAGIMRAFFGQYRTVHVSDHFNLADSEYWYPTATDIDLLVPRLYDRLSVTGYRAKDYKPQRHDCDDYTIAGMYEAHSLLMELTQDAPSAQNKAFPIHAFSFQRENGKRHRLFYIEDDKGRRHYVDSWRIHDKYHTPDGLYRILTKDEEANGVVVW